MSNIQTGAERMPHDLSHLGFLAGQSGRLITISTTPVIDRKRGSAGMLRPTSYAVFCSSSNNRRRLPQPSPHSAPFRAHAARHHSTVPSFPTRRSSDLNFNCRGFGPLLEDKLCLIFKLAPSVCRMTFPILASLLVRLVVLLPFQLLRL